MADTTLPIAAGAAPLSRAGGPPARAEAARAAQRAFFDAALRGAPAVVAAPAATPVQTTASPVQPIAPARPSQPMGDDAPPGRPLRPGSLVDIRV